MKLTLFPSPMSRGLVVAEGCVVFVAWFFAGEPDGVVANGVGDHTTAVIHGVETSRPSVAHAVKREGRECDGR